MKRLLLIIFMLLYAAFARAQGGNALVLTGAGAPAGACSYIMFWVQTSGAFWDCAAGTWNSVSGGGGGGTVTVVASGALTSTAFVTGGGTTTLQTPSATSTLSAGGNASFAGTLAASGHVTFEGVTSAGATGTGNLVFSASPTFTGTLLGAAAVFSTSIATGTAPAACGTATGCYAATEGTASNMTITASQDAFAADATAHAFKMTLNGGAIFLSAMNASLAPTGTIAVSLAGAPAGGKCLQSSGTAGLATEAAGACGSSTPSLDQVTGSAEQATATETAISHEWTYAGIETANLTYPIVFQNTNATNTTSGALAINVVGAGTSMVPVVINQPATDTGDSLDIYNGATFTNGVLSGGTIKASILPTGAFQPKGNTAGFLAVSQGTTSGAVVPCSSANTACFQGPAAITSYVANVPAAAPTANFSAWLFSDASPSVGTFAKMPQTSMLTTQYTNSTTGFTNVTGTNSLAFAVEANTTYQGTCTLYYQAASTGGLNIEFTGPASPTFVTYSLVDPGTATTFAAVSVATAYSTSLGAVVGTPTTNFPATVTFGISNGANAGTLQMLAKSSAAVQLQIQTGSFCVMQ